MSNFHLFPALFVRLLPCVKIYLTGKRRGEIVSAVNAWVVWGAGGDILILPPFLKRKGLVENLTPPEDSIMFVGTC